MAKPTQEIANKRGERVKELLKRYGWTQAQLAEKLNNMPESVLNAKLNGKRTLTEGDAIQIANLFPPVRKGWIMGEERYPTWGAELTGAMNQANQEGELLNIGFNAFAALNGYSVSFPELPSEDKGQIEQVLSALKQGFSISKDGKTVTLSVDEMNRLQNKICDHIGTELNYLFQEKGV